jgi:hypothetical protein
MKRKTILIAVLVLFAIGLVSAGLVYRFVYNKPHRDFEKARPAYIISAAELYDSFRNMRTEAEGKYNGQVVLLNGKLDKIELSDSIVTGVFIFNQGMFGDEGIRCSMLPGHASKLKSIAQGSEVSIKGYVTGYNDTDVIIEQCSLIRQ